MVNGFFKTSIELDGVATVFNGGQPMVKPYIVSKGASGSCRWLSGTDGGKTVDQRKNIV